MNQHNEKEIEERERGGSKNWFESWKYPFADRKPPAKVGGGWPEGNRRIALGGKGKEVKTGKPRKWLINGKREVPTIRGRRYRLGEVWVGGVVRSRASRKKERRGGRRSQRRNDPLHL